MRYPGAHRDETRQKIIRSARRLFNRFGFDKVSIERIMAEAGLTRGGFYRHFESKSDLFAETLGCFFTDPKWGNSWKGVSIDLDAADAGPQIIRAYLSRDHLINIDNSCPMVALPSDVARAGESAKRALETVFSAMVDILRQNIRHDDDPRRAALAIATLCVGGMVIARTMHEKGLTDELREAALAAALRLGGWDQPRTRRPRGRNGRAGRAHSG
jgi:AcrR family transcriptional regulator